MAAFCGKPWNRKVFLSNNSLNNYFKFDNLAMDSYFRCLVSNKACKGNWVYFLFSVFMMVFLPINGMVFDQQANRTVLNTQYGTANGINDLPGIDPSADVCTTGRPAADDSKIFYIYNEGTGCFLSIGGLWGTHASINNTPNAIWIENANNGLYYLNNKIDGSSTGTYIGVQNSHLYMDRSKAAGLFSFEHAEGYTDSNKLYRIKVSGLYVTTYPSNQDLLCNVTSGYAASNVDYKNQVWKIISKKEYYTLALANPATMKALLDFSFLMPDCASVSIIRMRNLGCWEQKTPLALMLLRYRYI